MTSTASPVVEQRLKHPGDPLLGKMAEDSGERGEILEDIPSDSQSREPDTADENDENETETIGSDEDEEDEGEDEEEEEDEPKLKNARMTGYMTQLYRNGDATSSFLVAGDKMVCLQ